MKSSFKYIIEGWNPKTNKWQRLEGNDNQKEAIRIAQKYEEDLGWRTRVRSD